MKINYILIFFLLFTIYNGISLFGSSINLETLGLFQLVSYTLSILVLSLFIQKKYKLV